MVSKPVYTKIAKARNITTDYADDRKIFISDDKCLSFVASAK